MDLPILSLILWSPLVVAFLVMVLPGEPISTPRRVAFLGSLVPLALSLWMLQHFDPAVGHLQMTESVPWLGSMGVYYSLGVDGISLWLVVLTTLLSPVILLAAWSDVEKRVKEYMFFMLFLEFSMLGALIAIDLFVFFVFWELMLVPMAFIIGIWGGPNRYYATVKFVIYTMAGSALMLVAMLYVVVKAANGGPLSFDVLTLYDASLSLEEQRWLFWAFAVAFLIKVPVFPLHTWLPDAHTEAPTGGSVQLAGILLKMGGYGFLRFAIPLFPLAAQEALPMILGLAVFGIVYGAMVATPQPDMKRLVAYSSVSHMGFVVLGIFAFNEVGISGGILQMINHGLTTGGLFLLIGFIYSRTHTRQISQYGGIWAIVPVFSSLFLVVTLGSIGLPGTNSFVGEFLILIGAFQTNAWVAAIATSGVVLGAVYMLTLYKRMAFGPVTNAENEKLTDLNGREIFTLVPIVLLIFWIGVYPRPFLDRIEPSVGVLLERIQDAQAAAEASPEHVAALEETH